MKHPNDLDARALKKRLEDRDVIIGVLRDRVQKLESAIDGVFDVIKHGDEAHQAWLREALREHFLPALEVLPAAPKPRTGGPLR